MEPPSGATKRCHVRIGQWFGSAPPVASEWKTEGGPTLNILKKPLYRFCPSLVGPHGSCVSFGATVFLSQSTLGADRLRQDRDLWEALAKAGPPTPEASGTGARASRQARVTRVDDVESESRQAEHKEVGPRNTARRPVTSVAGAIGPIADNSST